MRLCNYIWISLWVLVLSCQRDISSEQVELYPIHINGKYGYINAQGTVVVAPKFFSVNWFNGNRALVETTLLRKAIIDENGNIIFQDTTAFWYPAFQEGLLKAETKDRKTCFLDSLGKTRFCLSDSVFFVESGFSCGRLLVRLHSGIFAYLDTDGKEVYRFKHGFPGNYSEDIARRSFKGRTCYYNKKGRQLFCIKGWGGDFSNGLALVAQQNKTYFIDHKGKAKLVHLPYDTITPFVNGFAQITKNQQVGFINTDGKIIITPQYDKSLYFSSNVVAVQKQGKWQFLNEYNQVLFPKLFDEVAAPGFVGELAYVRQGKEWFYINKNGNIIWKSKVE